MKYLFFLTLLFSTSTDEKVPLGQFYSSNRFDHYELTLKENNQFTQLNGSCDWTYRANGKWSAHGDTINLTAYEVYDLHGGGRKKLVDSNSYSYDLFLRYNKCLIISQDTISLYRTDENGKILRTIKLHRKK